MDLFAYVVGVCVCVYMRMHSKISELIDKIQHEQLWKLQLSTKAIPSKLESLECQKRCAYMNAT